MNESSAESQLMEKVLAGLRINESDAEFLLREADLLSLGLIATIARNRHNDPKKVSFVIDRNVNYTNLCDTRCSFCAFFRKPGHPEGYVLDLETLRQKAIGTRDLGGTGFLLQGGVNPELPWDYYLKMVRFLSQDLGLWVHGFSPIEIRAMAHISSQTLSKTLQDLKDAGLGSLPGGGAEILVDRVRKRISPRKGTVDQWLEVMEEAHKVGLWTSATMMYGIGETLEERVQHLKVLRDQQDRALARQGGAYQAFIAWPFQSRNTVWEGKLPRPTDEEYLRTIAVARIYLDNFAHIQSSWVTMGPKTGQLALHYGCDDMGSLMLEENVVRAAGTAHSMNIQELDRLIRQAGFEPWQRDHRYQAL